MDRKLLSDNGKQLEYVDELAQRYRQHTPIWWYSRDCFLYPTLNRALRTMDADLMTKLSLLSYIARKQGWTDIVQYFSYHQQE